MDIPDQLGLFDWLSAILVWRKRSTYKGLPLGGSV